MSQDFSATHPAHEFAEALHLAMQALGDHKIDAEEYLLVAAETLRKGPSYEGPRVWRLTFKLKSLIPADRNGMLGAGGEVFVRVDLNTYHTVINFGE